MNWIECMESLPTNYSRILVIIKYHNGNRRITVADYIAPETVLAEDYLSDDCDMEFSESCYDKEKDTYWAPEGFYESNIYHEMNIFINDTVTHWMPLPKLPEKE